MRNERINLLKGIACYLVVLNHFHPGKVLGDIIYTFSHCGVPIFFMISGYYFLDKDSEISIRRMTNKIRHILVLLIVHIFLYTGYECIQKWLITGNVTGVLHTIFSIKIIAKAILIGTGINGGGQWFLVSTLMTYIILGIVFQFRWKLILVKYAHMAASILIVVHIPLRMYVIKSGIQGYDEFSLLETYSVRNTWFDAIPFMLYGISLRKYQNLIHCIKHPVVMSIIAVILSIGEYFFSKRMLEPYQMNSVLYVGTVLAVIFIMIWAVDIECNPKESILSIVGSKYSMLIYFLHPIVGWTMQALFIKGNFFTSNMASEILFSISIILITTELAIFFIKIKTLIRKVRS